MQILKNGNRIDYCFMAGKDIVTAYMDEEQFNKLARHAATEGKIDEPILGKYNYALTMANGDKYYFEAREEKVDMPEPIDVEEIMEADECEEEQKPKNNEKKHKA